MRSLRLFWAISTPKTTKVAVTKNQNKAISAIVPPNKYKPVVFMASGYQTDFKNPLKAGYGFVRT
jgi:hypothetical protein